MEICKVLWPFEEAGVEVRHTQWNFHGWLQGEKLIWGRNTPALFLFMSGVCRFFCVFLFVCLFWVAQQDKTGERNMHECARLQAFWELNNPIIMAQSKYVSESIIVWHFIVPSWRCRQTKSEIFFPAASSKNINEKHQVQFKGRVFCLFSLQVTLYSSLTLDSPLTHHTARCTERKSQPPLPPLEATLLAVKTMHMALCCHLLDRRKTALSSAAVPYPDRRN